MKLQKYIFVAAFLSGMLAVVVGAFGAHVLKEQWELTESSLRTFGIGVDYHFYHSFALAITGLLVPYLSPKLLRWASRLFVLGIVLFSGSLYLLATRFALGIEHWKFLGPLTPMGGMCFITAWFLLFLAALRMSNDGKKD